MTQVINVNNKESKVKSEMLTNEKEGGKVKTKFQEEWEKGIPADKAFDDLLNYVKDLWKK